MKKKISLDMEPLQRKTPFESLGPIELIKQSGKHQFGNRPDYYHRRGTSLEVLDSRVMSLDFDHFYNKTVLDVGCHCGLVTLQIARSLRPAYIKGIDIDYRLVNKAVTNWAYEEKLAQVERKKKEPGNSQLIETIEALKKFPQSILQRDARFKETVLGSGNAKKMEIESEVEYPHNVSFEISNILDIDELREKKKYDCVMCLSVTKWIHLNYGDEGVKKMFRKVKMCLKEGGRLYLEVQKFKAYNKKLKEFERFAEVYPKIAFLPEHFEEYLVGSLGFVREDVLNTKNVEAFKRDILIYRLGAPQE